MKKCKYHIGVILIVSLLIQLCTGIVAFAEEAPMQEEFLSFRIYDFDREVSQEEANYQEIQILSGRLEHAPSTRLLKDCCLEVQEEEATSTKRFMTEWGADLKEQLQTYPMVDGVFVEGWDVYTREIEDTFDEVERSYCNGQISAEELAQEEQRMEHTAWRRRASLESCRMDQLGDAKAGYVQQITLFPRFNCEISLVKISNLIDEDLQIRDKFQWELCQEWKSCTEQEKEDYLNQKVLQYQAETNQNLELEGFDVTVDGLQLELKARYRKRAFVLHYAYHNGEDVLKPEPRVVYCDANQQVDDAFLENIFQQNIPSQLEGDDVFFQWQITPRPGITDGYHENDKSVNELYLSPDYSNRMEVKYVYKIEQTGESFERIVLFPIDTPQETIEANGRGYFGKFAKENDVKAWKFVKKMKTYYVLEGISLKEAVDIENTEKSLERKKEKSVIDALPENMSKDKKDNLQVPEEEDNDAESVGDDAELKTYLQESKSIESISDKSKMTASKNFWKQVNEVYVVIGGIAAVGTGALIAGTVITRKRKKKI